MDSLTMKTKHNSLFMNSIVYMVLVCLLFYLTFDKTLFPGLVWVSCLQLPRIALHEVNEIVCIKLSEPK